MNLSHELREAVFHHQSGRLDAAHLIYTKLLSRFPHNPDALHLSGLIAHQRGDLKLARERISKSIVRRYPDSAIVHNDIRDLDEPAQAHCQQCVVAAQGQRKNCVCHRAYCLL